MRRRRALPDYLFFGCLICALACVPAQAQKRQGRQAAAQAKTAQPKPIAYYSCPMHESVKSKSPGKCPKCGMVLRAVHEDEALTQAAAATPDEATAQTSETRAGGDGYGQISKMNIPDVELLDQDGRKIHFYTDLVKGKTVVINFIFTTCTTICPPLGATFARVQKDLGERVGRDVHFISISVDPATDTPERLKVWGAKFKAGAGWTFVTGDKPSIDNLLNALAASTARREDHSPTVLIGNDARSTWTRTYGLAKPSQLVQIINDAIEGKTAQMPKETLNQ